MFNIIFHLKLILINLNLYKYSDGLSIPTLWNVFYFTNLGKFASEVKLLRSIYSLMNKLKLLMLILSHLIFNFHAYKLTKLINYLLSN